MGKKNRNNRKALENVKEACLLENYESHYLHLGRLLYMASLEKPLVSVIIVNYNGKDFLVKCLSSVFRTNYPIFEVILVDNGSTDGSLEAVNKLFAHSGRLKIVKNHANVGFAEANNIGFGYSRGKYVVLLNNDTVVDSEWISELVKVMESDSSIAAAQSKILLMDHPRRFDCAGGFIDYDGTTYPRGHFAQDIGQYEKIEEIFTCKGAAMIIRKDALLKVGLFDSSYFFYYEETDLCWRFWLAGYKVLYVPSSVVYHKGGGSVPKDMSQQFFYNVYLLNRGRIMTLLKNYEIWNIIRYLMPWMLLQIEKIVSAGLKGYRRSNILYSLALTRAILWNLRNLSSIWKKRLYVQKIVRKFPDNEVMHKMKLKAHSDLGNHKF
jgi:GT2 family glycosyltransferase